MRITTLVELVLGASLTASIASCGAPTAGSSSSLPDTTKWELDSGGDNYNGFPTAIYCAEQRNPELTGNNPKSWVRVCITTVSHLHKVFGPIFNGGLVDVEGFGRIHTFKYDSTSLPSAEFHVFGTPAYEKRVIAALVKAKTVTINGVVLNVGNDMPWFKKAPKAVTHEYTGDDQHQPGYNR